MLIPNYDAEAHFTNSIVKTLQEHYPDLAYSISSLRSGRIVKWETNSGIHSWCIPVIYVCHVPVWYKEDLFELLNKIKETE